MGSICQYSIHYPYHIILPTHVIEVHIEERIEVTGRRERRHKQLLDDPKA